VIVSAAGAFFNILFALFLGLIVWKITGEPTSSSLLTSTVAEIRETLVDLNGKEVPSPASIAGLKSGDTILKVDGKPVQWFGEVFEQLALGSGWNEKGERQTVFTIKRGDQVFDLTLNPIQSGHDKRRMVGFTPLAIIKFKAPHPGSTAEKVGLLDNDRVVEMNHHPILTLDKFIDELKQRTKGPVPLTVLRGKEQVSVVLPAAPDFKEATSLFQDLQPGVIYTHPNPIQQIVNAATRTFGTLFALINPRSDVGIGDVGGTIQIMANFFDLAKEGMPFVLWFTILVNVSLAIFNLLPIPILDGGHILFATISKLRGKSLPIDFVATAQSIFMVLILSLMVYLGYRDVRRLSYDGDDKPAKAAPAQQTEQSAAPTPAPAVPAPAPAKP
jgi:regulator of sigma E protease